MESTLENYIRTSAKILNIIAGTALTLFVSPTDTFQEMLQQKSC
jgi:hypothetical protein